MEDHIVELRLSQPVNVTDSRRVRQSLQERVETEQLECVPVELVNFNVLICCTAGTGTHMVDFVDHRLEPGTTIWVRPGQVQQWSDTDGDFDAEVVVFAAATIPDLALFEQPGAVTRRTELGDDTARVLEVIRWIRADLDERQDFATVAAAVSVILRVLSRNAVEHPRPLNPRGELVQAFIESIERNIEQRSVTWHAHNIGASTRSVSRASIEVLSLRPKEVIDDHVILEARRRLAWSDDGIGTISRSLRFSEPSNFTKFFRAHTGQSPLAFRQGVAALERSIPAAPQA